MGVCRVVEGEEVVREGPGVADHAFGGDAGAEGRAREHVGGPCARDGYGPHCPCTGCDFKVADDVCLELDGGVHPGVIVLVVVRPAQPRRPSNPD